MSLNSTSVINSSCPKSHSFQNVRETETKMCLQDRKNWNYETPMPNGTPILCFPQNLHYIPVFFTFLLLPGGGGNSISNKSFNPKSNFSAHGVPLKWKHEPIFWIAHYPLINPGVKWSNILLPNLETYVLCQSPNNHHIVWSTALCLVVYWALWSTTTTTTKCWA